MKLDLPQNLEPQVFMIDLQGEGYVPQIRLLDPVSGNDDNSVINFGLSLITDLHTKTFKIQNVGQVIAELTIKIFDDPNAGYSIHLDENQNKLPCNCSNKENGLWLHLLRCSWAIRCLLK